eukprot:comp12631_c1_seq1/m.16725 comp12631_c1_seq1/g.16725  ORF comp12631_c1_seq1/g.16725 comp12631_c1_seq1/m.16725 type:complete len:313 (+) comp12631_c1_seq1:1359-2297(+)
MNVICAGHSTLMGVDAALHVAGAEAVVGGHAGACVHVFDDLLRPERVHFVDESGQQSAAWMVEQDAMEPHAHEPELAPKLAVGLEMRICEFGAIEPRKGQGVDACECLDDCFCGSCRCGHQRAEQLGLAVEHRELVGFQGEQRVERHKQCDHCFAEIGAQENAVAAAERQIAREPLKGRGCQVRAVAVGQGDQRAQKRDCVGSGPAGRDQCVCDDEPLKGLEAGLVEHDAVCKEHSVLRAQCEACCPALADACVDHAEKEKLLAAEEHECGERQARGHIRLELHLCVCEMRREERICCSWLDLREQPVTLGV